MTVPDGMTIGGGGAGGAVVAACPTSAAFECTFGASIDLLGAELSADFLDSDGSAGAGDGLGAGAASAVCSGVDDD
jgi:hypothetical protein